MPRIEGSVKVGLNDRLRYNNIVKRFEFELILKHFDIEIVDPSNLIGIHINDNIFAKIIRFNDKYESIQENYLKKNGFFPEIIERLDAFEHALMLSQEDCRNHTAHMFNVLCMGNVFLSNGHIKEMCKEYLQKILGEIDIDPEKWVSIILECFWIKNNNNNLLNFIRENMQRVMDRDNTTLLDILTYLLWFLIATNHDIARSIEKSSLNIKELFEVYGIDVEIQDPTHPLQRPIRRKKESMVNKWEESVWRKKIQPDLFPFNTYKLVDYNIRDEDFIDDHAHISALSVWESLSKQFDDIGVKKENPICECLIYLISWPILLHHLPEARRKDDRFADVQFSFQDHPFLGLLILCDTLQIWGRESFVVGNEKNGISKLRYDFDLYRPLISRVSGHLTPPSQNLRSVA